MSAALNATEVQPRPLSIQSGPASKHDPRPWLKCLRAAFGSPKRALRSIARPERGGRWIRQTPGTLS